MPRVAVAVGVAFATWEGPACTTSDNHKVAEDRGLIPVDLGAGCDNHPAVGTMGVFGDSLLHR